ncbi:MaoC family dehydratase [bacterium]|nr:MAG: MaoC family dehydratase [bacterium]
MGCDPGLRRHGQPRRTAGDAVQPGPAAARRARPGDPQGHPGGGHGQHLGKGGRHLRQGQSGARGARDGLEGGWGGESGPKSGNEKPDRDPDLVVESKTLPQQALLYRLSGDKNPLHADPEFSKLGGFEVPILHGLCSYGVVCKAVVDNMLGGDTGKVARYQARFAGVVFPGETIVTAMWKEGNTILVDAKVKERGLNVISNAAITTR